jgi:hypothetical protein
MLNSQHIALFSFLREQTNQDILVDNLTSLAY